MWRSPSPSSKIIRSNAPMCSVEIHGLADASENYYMEREWRVDGHAAFDVSDVHCVMIPSAYKFHFESDYPEYRGEIHPVG
jgi:hypothetical protein